MIKVIQTRTPINACKTYAYVSNEAPFTSLVSLAKTPVIFPTELSLES